MAQYNGEIRTELEDMNIKIEYTLYGNTIEYDVDYEGECELLPYDTGKTASRKIQGDEFLDIIEQNEIYLNLIIDDTIEKLSYDSFMETFEGDFICLR